MAIICIKIIATLLLKAANLFVGLVGPRSRHFYD